MPRLPVARATATTVELAGRDVLAFGGCNYLGLAHHPAVLQAAADAIPVFGLSTSASRETTGNTLAHDELESALASMLGCGSVVVTPDGYTANIAATEALAQEYRVALIDARAHRSIHEAAGGAGMRIVEYDHRDPASASARAKEHAGEKIALFTDGVFATDGAIAPVPQLLDAMPASAVVVVDDCHGLGVLGPGGRGTIAHFGLDAPNRLPPIPPRLVVTSSLAKGVGCHGGLIGGWAGLDLTVRSCSPAYLCSTPVSPVLAVAACRSLRVIAEEPQRLDRLRRNIEHMNERLIGLGIDIVCSPTPIFAFTLGSKDRMHRLHRDLLDEGILAPLIDYPGGPAPTYFRLSLNAEHTPEQIDRLINAIKRRLHMQA
jgi:7-keto-8-aminopelargonate synthetase-like enzyme